MSSATPTRWRSSAGSQGHRSASGRTPTISGQTRSEAIAALRRLAFPFFAIEEPIGRNRHAELPDIARALNCRIVLDESFVRRDQLALLSEPRSQWIVNVRVSKMGGLIRSLQVVEAARRHGVDVIVGAQVGETSLLTRAALPVAERPASGWWRRKAPSEPFFFSATPASRRSCSAQAEFSKYRRTLPWRLRDWGRFHSRSSAAT